MKRFLCTILIAAPLGAHTAGPSPSEKANPETISVTGNGRATVTPDRFSFTAGVQTTAPSVDEAVNENNTKMAAVIAALKKAGATDQEIRTSNFSIFPQQVYEQGRPPRITGYQAANSVTVTKKDIGEAGRLLQVVVNAGVNQSSGLSFEVSDLSRGRDQGLRAAFDDAHGKAALLAHAAGRTLGRALSIVEGGASTPIPRPMAMQAMAARAEAVSAVPVEGGTRELTYSVSVIFEMR